MMMRRQPFVETKKRTEHTDHGIANPIILTGPDAGNPKLRAWENQNISPIDFCL